MGIGCESTMMLESSDSIEMRLDLCDELNATSTRVRCSVILTLIRLKHFATFIDIFDMMLKFQMMTTTSKQ